MKKLPERRGFLIEAGLEQVLDFLGTTHFTPEEIGWLESRCSISSAPRISRQKKSAGLEQVLDFLGTTHFTPEEIGWLESTGRFGGRLIESFVQFRFTVGVHAMPEGTVFFPNEPILRVIAPLPQAQLAERRLINILQFQPLPEPLRLMEPGASYPVHVSSALLELTAEADRRLSAAGARGVTLRRA